MQKQVNGSKLIWHRKLWMAGVLSSLLTLAIDGKAIKEAYPAIRSPYNRTHIGKNSASGVHVVRAIPDSPNRTTSSFDGIKITDKAFYAEPSPSAMPHSGAISVDKVFGTQVIRVTDGSDGNSGCINRYSYWSSININSTRIMALCSINGYGTPTFYKLDPIHFRVSNKTTWKINAQANDLAWSSSNPDEMYGHNGRTMYAFNVVTRRRTKLFDLTQAVGNGNLPYQMSKSADDNIFAGSIHDSSDNTVIGYFVYRKSDQKVLLRKMDNEIDEIEIDKGGRYLVTEPANSAPAPHCNHIINLQTKSDIILCPQTRQGRFYHHDVGHGNLLSDSNYDSKGDNKYWGIRSLADPLKQNPAVYFYNWDQDAHFSMLAKNETWGLVSAYRKDGGRARGPFENEILQIAADGRVRRLAHHYSIVKSYYDAPRADISRDGQFVAFTSNWGGGRRDLYVAKIPPAPAR